MCSGITDLISDRISINLAIKSCFAIYEVEEEKRDLKTG